MLTEPKIREEQRQCGDKVKKPEGRKCQQHQHSSRFWARLMENDAEQPKHYQKPLSFFHAAKKMPARLVTNPAGIL